MPVVDQIDDNLHVPLRLHRAAHHAERQPRLPVLQDEGGMMVWKRALAGRVVVGVAGLEGEHVRRGSGNLKPSARHDHAAADAAVVALDERHQVAVGVGRREVVVSPSWGAG
jgi:hypothetical protein